MKRFWLTFLAIATATMANTANAQLNESGEIGSYQSILSRAGYGDGSGTTSPVATSSDAQVYGAPQLQAAPVQAAPVQAVPAVPSLVTGHTGQGCANGNCPGGVTNQAAYGAWGGYTSQAPSQSVLTQAPLQSGAVGGYAGSVEGGAVIDQGYVGNNIGSYAAPSPIINYTQPALSQPVYSQPVISQPVISQPVFSQPIISQPVYSAPVYTPQPTYQTVPVYVAGQSFAPSRPKPNFVFGLFGVSLRRDYEDGVRLAYRGQNDNFFSDDVSHGNFSGIGASLASRNQNGTGWEVRYWGLDESDEESFGSGTTHLRFDDVFHSPSNTGVKSIFDNADDLTLGRTTRINSLAFNLLRNGGKYKSRFGYGNFELLGGFRIFQFDEDLQFAANSSRFPTRLEYALETENLLTGFQVGCRNEVCVGKRLRFTGGANVGVFNNRVNTRQRIFDETGAEASIDQGRSFNFEDEKDDVAFLGEFNAGFIYPISHRFRLNAGYKVVGVAGVALAADQIPREFTDVRALETANSNGSLLLHGFTYGAEFSF